MYDSDTATEEAQTETRDADGDTGSRPENADANGSVETDLNAGVDDLLDVI